MSIFYQDDDVTLYNDDCNNIISSLDYDVIMMDPPYSQEFHDRGNLTRSRPNYKKISEYGSEQNLNYTDIFNLLKSKIKENNIFSFCNKETKYELITEAKKHGWNYQELSFCKTSPTPFTNNQWLVDMEFGVHLFKNLKVRGNYKTKSSFFVMSNFKEKNVNHPTPKKVGIVYRILENISEENQTILDPFAGSGTTGIACKQLHRKCILIEKNIEYCEIIKQRLRQDYLF